MLDRIMSSSELPPIASAGKRNGLITNGYNKTSLVGINNNTNNNNNNIYTFTLDSRYQKRNSVHSDSSIQGYVTHRGSANHSRTSSSSSQRSRGRVLSAGADKRILRQVLTADLPKDILSSSKARPDSATMTKGPGSIGTQRCVTLYEKKKTSVKDMASSGPRPLQPSTSESQLSQRIGSTNGYLKRICSEKSITESTKRTSGSKQQNQNNSKNNNNNNSKQRSAINNNVNGMRKYSSTLGLDTKDERRSDESTNNPDGADCLNDSDSDSEKDQRVIQWIMGVNEMAEPPEEPKIEHVDEPPQRDTAIRIVYDGDT